jgi:hypothetical protein
LREEHRPRVYENRMLSWIFGPKREEEISLRKLHNYELHSLYSSRILLRLEEGRSVYRVLVGRLEGKRPLGRPRLRWKDNIKMDLREKGIDGANWIRLA